MTHEAPDNKTLLIGTLNSTDLLPAIPETEKDHPFPYVGTKVTVEL